MDRILRLPDVKALTGLGRSTIYLKMAKGEFPGAVKLGERAVAWPQVDIARWIQERVAASRPIPAGAAEGIRAEIYEGLAYGSGDSVIGINPVDDSYGSVSRLLDMSYDIIKTWKYPLAEFRPGTCHHPDEMHGIRLAGRACLSIHCRLPEG